MKKYIVISLTLLRFLKISDKNQKIYKGVKVRSVLCSYINMTGNDTIL